MPGGGRLLHLVPRTSHLTIGTLAVRHQRALFLRAGIWFLIFLVPQTVAIISQTACDLFLQTALAAWRKLCGAFKTSYPKSTRESQNSNLLYVFPKLRPPRTGVRRTRRSLLPLTLTTIIMPSVKQQPDPSHRGPERSLESNFPHLCSRW